MACAHLGWGSHWSFRQCQWKGFPGGSVGKESCNAGDLGSIPASGSRLSSGERDLLRCVGNAGKSFHQGDLRLQNGCSSSSLDIFLSQSPDAVVRPHGHPRRNPYITHCLNPQPHGTLLSSRRWSHPMSQAGGGVTTRPCIWARTTTES